MPDNDLPSQEAEQPQQEAIQTPQEPNEPTPQPSEEPQPQDPPAQEPSPEPVQDVDWRRRATEQGQENIILNHRVQQDEKARRELTNEPTESDLQAAFPEWDLMTPTEQLLAKKSLVAERRTEALLLKEQKREADVRWDTDLELAIAQNPSLQGKEQAFKAFANRPNRRGIDPDVLIKAFLYDPAPAVTAPAPAPAPGLLSGNGGPRGSDKPKLLSGDALKQLRQTDEKAYKEYIRTHDITQID
ncbi:MAG TPA: hypothetical protein VGF48_05885 [Thermoanaerobaculia bacterium]|jgi:hypothetical protein